MFLRGSPSWSIARQVTISACVESRPPDTPMIAFSRAARLQALRQALDLDVVGLVAIVAQLGRDRTARRGSARRRARAPRCRAAPRARSSTLRKRADLVALDHARSRRSRCCAAAPGGCGRDRRRRVTMVESFSKRAVSASWSPQFVDRGVAVPGEVGRRFARAGRRIGVGRDGARRLAAAQQAPRLGLADGDVAGRQVDQHLRAGERRVARRRHRHPDVLADLDMEGDGHACRSSGTACRCRTAPRGRRA